MRQITLKMQSRSSSNFFHPAYDFLDSGMTDWIRRPELSLK